MNKLFCIILVGFVSINCKMPNTTVQTIDGRSTIRVTEAPSGAILFLDGKPIGPADAFSGDPNVLSVEPGTHIIEIKKDGATLLSQRIFFGGGEMRSISVPREVKS